MSKPFNKNEAIAELLESEAIVKYYLNNATLPAITINDGAFKAPDAKKNEPFTLWFSLIGHFNFKKLKDAEAKAMEILKTTKKKQTVRIVPRKGKTQIVEIEPQEGEKHGER